MIFSRILSFAGMLLAVVLGIDAMIACWNQTIYLTSSTRVDDFHSYPLSESRPNTSLLKTDEIVPESFNSFQFVRMNTTSFIEELRFHRSGSGIYRYVDFNNPEMPVMQTEFFVSDWHIAAICAVLRNADFCSLDDAYEADVPFQFAMAIRVESLGVGKEVVCREYFPKRFDQVVKYLNRDFLPGLGLQHHSFKPVPKSEAEQWKHFMIDMPLPDEWATQKETLDQ
ncbi:hypothetical protein Pan97_01540 [Bremerella volcania]|uniref:Uncharacterized protein n=1 Tax=Bremerella volcania TaxID=2527984 RepID=A0A518C1T3_9BACT|nr:hypothetical protein [Bremerella volcania]QDU73187.1 hypothetical protein Pan97_01540 [Bremerella volcania]